VRDAQGRASLQEAASQRLVWSDGGPSPSEHSGLLD